MKAWVHSVLCCMSFLMALGVFSAADGRVEAPRKAFALSSIPETWQSQVIGEANEIYLPFAAAQGKAFQILIRSESPLESAEAYIETGGMGVIINGGLLKNANLTADGLRVILCHEIGHIFAGAPRKDLPVNWTGPSSADGKSLFSSEGQADYYATSVCFRRLIRKDPEKLDPTRGRAPVPLRVLRQCEQSYGKSTWEKNICVRGAMGGENMLQLVRKFPISFDTPDQTRPSESITNSYPSRQCRLDTFFAGALCKNTFGLELDPFVADKNDCTDASATRPACWYARAYLLIENVVPSAM